MRPRKKWLIAIAIVSVLLLPLILAVGWRVVTGRSDHARLLQLQAELDATDPGWRLEDILAAHEASLPPGDQNAITATEGAKRLLPKAYLDWREDHSDWLPKEPNQLPQPSDLARAREARSAAADAIAEARRLRELPKGGGVKLTIKPDVISTLIPHTQNIRESSLLLHLDAVMAAYDGDPDRAVASVHAGVYVGRAIGEEPFLVSMLIRMTCARDAKNALEWVLGLSEPSAGLAEVQAAFAQEAETPLLTIGFRGQRAMMDHLFENIDNGTVSVNLTLVQTLEAISSTMTRSRSSTNPLEHLRVLQYRTPPDHAKMLEILTRYVEISRQPTHEQQSLYEQVERPPQTQDLRHLFTRLLLPGLDAVIKADFRFKANLRSTVVGIACERFRQAQGRWPNELAEIPKDILPEIPLDPYDGQPLRYRRTADGVVIYSIGPDLVDNGGNLLRENKEEKPGEDYGFRLWDPQHRRAAPLLLESQVDNGP
jgi:hypothetical protein